MKFLIQKLESFDMETELLYDIAHRNQYLYHAERGYFSFLTDDYENKKDLLKKELLKEYIPAGTIEFVEKFLQVVWDIPYMQPIEIPEVLRKEEYLLRDYKIVNAEDIPKTGYLFIKDASRLKQFSYNGDLSRFITEDIFEKENGYQVMLNKDHKYVVSDVMDILSEYRVFVSNDEIKGIQYYDGNPLIIPNEKEIEKLKKIVLNYQLDSSRPKSYTIDTAVIKTKNERDLAIIEVHPFACIGLYGFYSEALPFMYKDGFDWYLKGKNK